MGGFESQNVSPLDEFELQAAHYNIACAHAKVGNLKEVCNVNEMYSTLCCDFFIKRTQSMALTHTALYCTALHCTTIPFVTISTNALFPSLSSVYCKPGKIV